MSELLQEIRKMVRKSIEEQDAQIKKIWEETDYATKLAITRYVMNRIWEHATEGGSYRYLIYERLGFDMDAYSYLFPVGMDISNEFDASARDTVCPPKGMMITPSSPRKSR